MTVALVEVQPDEERLARLKLLRARVDAEIKSVEGEIRRRTRRRKAAVRQQLPAAHVPTSVIRAWLLEQGRSVGDRGRISYELRQEYSDAH